MEISNECLNGRIYWLTEPSLNEIAILLKSNTSYDLSASSHSFSHPVNRICTKAKFKTRSSHFEAKLENVHSNKRSNIIMRTVHTYLHICCCERKMQQMYTKVHKFAMPHIIIYGCLYWTRYLVGGYYTLTIIGINRAYIALKIYEWIRYDNTLLDFYFSFCVFFFFNSFICLLDWSI